MLCLSSPDDIISEETSLAWLQSKAAAATIMPTTSSDPAYYLHRCFMHGAFLYSDLRDAIRYEDGPQIIRLWKHWLLYFLGAESTLEAVNSI